MGTLIEMHLFCICICICVSLCFVPMSFDLYSPFAFAQVLGSFPSTHTMITSIFSPPQLSKLLISFELILREPHNNNNNHRASENC